MSDKQLAKTGKTEDQAMALFSEQLPAHLQNQPGRGNESVGREDVTIPRVDLIQDISPQRKKNDPQYIEGAEEGMFFNTVTQELYGPAFMFVPVFFKKEFIIWKDRKKGGGFNGAFDTMEEAEAALAKIEGDKADFAIVDTAQHFGLVVDPASSIDNPITEEVVISMAKSKMKASRKFNSMIRIAGGDRFSKAYRMVAVQDQNKEGQKYFNVNASPLGFVPPVLYKKAEALYNAVISGQKAIDRTAEDLEQAAPGGEPGKGDEY